MSEPRPALSRHGAELVAASFVVLFQELALIRWIPAEVRVAAYFPNLILIGAFLGLGVGALRARERSLLWMWPASLVALTGSAWLMSGVAFTANDVTEHLWLLYHDLPEAAPVVEGIRIPLLVIFALTAASFVPLGQFVGTRLETFRAHSSALWGYALDLGGSLLGVVGFAFISYGGLPPLVWFLVPLAVGMAVVVTEPRVRLLYGACAGVVIAVVVLTTGENRYSPYYALDHRPIQETEVGLEGHDIRANGSLHQRALDVAGRSEASQLLVTTQGYHLPHQRLGRPVRRALVLGAGTGNDVAVLLAEGAEEIHAVEIDPVILDLGRELLPNAPYADPRVTIHNTDARSFLNEEHEPFDLIVFGTLDSMTRLSALSNVRLDNFVYTREALAAARRHLTDDGGLALYFMVGEQYIADHLTALLGNVFGSLPRIHRGGYALFNTIFMAGPAFVEEAEAAPVEEPWFLRDEMVARAAPTDDWPYLYLPERGLSSFYLSMMVLLGALGAAAILSASGAMREALLKGKGVDVEMFLYGFAFLLIETKFVTAMNLVWGATWLTSAVVFGSILATILVGTILMELKPVPWQVAGAGLVLALLLTYALPPSSLLSTSAAVKLVKSVLYVGAPIVFASLCFAVRFKARPAADLAFGWNLLGAVLGGLTEFFSMALGFRALTLVAVGAYLLAFLASGRAPDRAEAS